MPATSAGMTGKFTCVARNRGKGAIYEKANCQVQQGRDRPRQDRRGFFAVDRLVLLTDLQVSEVRRRRADPNRKLVSHAAARKRIGRLGF
jgi:hypothetical protein